MEALLLPPTKEEVNVFARVCLSVCLLARLLKNSCMDWMKCCVSTDVRTWTNWLTFEPNPDYSPDAGTGLLSPISYKRSIRGIWKSHVHVGLLAAWFLEARASRGFKMVLFTEASDNLCRRYMRYTECPSSVFVTAVSASVPCHQYWFCFARILNGFRWNLREIRFTATDRLNDHILGDIGRGTREQVWWHKVRIDVKRCCCDVKQVLTPSEWIHKISEFYTEAVAIADLTSRLFKDFAYKYKY